MARAEEMLRETQKRLGAIPRPLDPLERIAGSLDRLVVLQSDAQTPADPAEDILEWLSTLDHNELDDAVMRRQQLGTPVMFTVLEVLMEWSASARP